MARTRAAVCRAFGAPLTIEEIEVAAPPAQAIEVTLAACAICHSDIAYADGAWGGALPAVYGHEAAGRVSAVGPDVAGLAVGDPVIVTLIRSCGACPACGSGRPVACSAPPALAPLSLADGTPVAQAMNSGAFAERVVVHRSQVVPVPAGLALDAAALLACGVITGVGAVVNSAGLRAGEDVVVIGAGGVGLNAIQGARIAGARRIVAVDVAEAKLADALAFGATDVLVAGGTTDGPAPWERAAELLGRGADVVLVTVGAVAAFDAAPHYLGPGGRMVLVGMPPTGARSGYEPANIASAGQRLVGSKMGDAVIARDIPWLADLAVQGRLKLDELITRRWRLEEINEAIADTRAGHARRNVIVFD